MFHGSIVALITPFINGKVDREALKGLISWHIDSGTKAIVVCGSTGEAALLTYEERHQLLHDAVLVADKRVPIIAGCGSPGTAEGIGLVRQAKDIGVDAALIVSPYYVKPSQQGLYEHFFQIHDAVDLPLILYNNPGRTCVDMSLELIARLAKLPRIVGLKDSNADVSRVIALRRMIAGDFSLLSGDDPLAAAYLANGGNGCISVTANAAPHLCQQLMTSWFHRDLDHFAMVRDQLDILNRALSIETNPITIKCAVAELGYCQNEIRAPLLPASAQSQQLIREALQTVGIL